MQVIQTVIKHFRVEAGDFSDSLSLFSPCSIDAVAGRDASHNLAVWRGLPVLKPISVANKTVKPTSMPTI